MAVMRLMDSDMFAMKAMLKDSQKDFLMVVSRVPLKALLKEALRARLKRKVSRMVPLLVRALVYFHQR